MNVMLCNQYVLDFLLWVEGGHLITTNSGIQQEIYWKEKKPNQTTNWKKAFLLG